MAEPSVRPGDVGRRARRVFLGEGGAPRFPDGGGCGVLGGALFVGVGDAGEFARHTRFFSSHDRLIIIIS